MRVRSPWLMVAASLGAVAFACSATSRPSFNAASDAGTDAAGSSVFLPPDASACSGLECNLAQDCPSGTKTTLRGKVYDPAGSNPLYNIQVYIPSGDEPEKLPPLKNSLTDGIVCETCAATAVNPLRAALTDSKGEFVLEDVPVSSELPVVVQVGKWRRLMKVDTSKACAENVPADGSLRLPAKSSEGDMPQIAVTSGSADALECLLRGIGVAESEFVNGDNPSGHVHMYKGYQGGMGADVGSFWNSAAELGKYDLTLLSCEGDEHNENKANIGAMYDYLNAGGKVFATHYHYTWFRNSPYQEFKDIASWSDEFDAQDGLYDINQTFPKGAEFAKWIKEIGASASLGQILLKDVRMSVSSPGSAATPWILDNRLVPKYFSFNTPLASPVEQQCGRAVFSDIHIEDLTSIFGSPETISECPTKPGKLNPQQKALEFLFFDLSACVTDDKTPPPPPK